MAEVAGRRHSGSVAFCVRRRTQVLFLPARKVRRDRVPLTRTSTRSSAAIRTRCWTRRSVVVIWLITGTSTRLWQISCSCPERRVHSWTFRGRRSASTSSTESLTRPEFVQHPRRVVATRRERRKRRRSKLLMPRARRLHPRLLLRSLKLLTTTTMTKTLMDMKKTWRCFERWKRNRRNRCDRPSLHVLVQRRSKSLPALPVQRTLSTIRTSEGKRVTSTVPAVFARLDGRNPCRGGSMRRICEKIRLATR
mmetsp:Transcript_2914/g.7500  ORF Transcript_2914/g.7500 Transcript_2914/m.7500 type:complete len:251 (-) Transcript_2914:284-1036(-)